MTSEEIVLLGKWLEELEEVSSFPGGYLPVKVDGTDKKLFKISRSNFVKDLPATPSGNPHVKRWFVAASGDDGANGAPETPFLTVPYAITQMASGDTLILGPGSFGNIVIDKALVIQGAAKNLTSLGDISFLNNFVATDTIIRNATIAGTLSMSGATAFILGLENVDATVLDSSLYNLSLTESSLNSNGGIKTLTLSGVGALKNSDANININSASIDLNAGNLIGDVNISGVANLTNSYLEGSITGIIGSTFVNIHNTTHNGNIIDVDENKVTVNNQYEGGEGYVLKSTKIISPAFEVGLDWHGRTSLVDLGGGIWACAFIAGTSHSPGGGEILKTAIMFSDDQGVTWSDKNEYVDTSAIVGFEREGGTGGFTGDLQLIKCPDGSLLVIAHDRTSDSLVFEDHVISRSLDGGKNWDAYRSIGAQFENGAINTWGIYDHYIEGSRIYITVTTCPDRATQVLTANKTMVYYSDNQGENWTKVDDINALGDLELEGGIVKMPNGSFISVSANRTDWSVDSNVYVKPSGGSWGKIGTVDLGGSVHQARLKYFAGDDRLYMFGRWQISGVRKNAMYWSDDNGLTWDVFFPTGDITDGGYTDCLKRTDGTFYVVGYYGSSSAAQLYDYVIKKETTNTAGGIGTGTVPSYADAAAMLADRVNQVVDALYFEEDEKSTYKLINSSNSTMKTVYELISAPSVHREYNTLALLFADQANQWENYTYYVEGATSEVQTFLVYNVPIGDNPVGDITDYIGGGVTEIPWVLPCGPLDAVVDVARVYSYTNELDRNIEGFSGNVDVAPSGGPATFDIKINGVSILSTLINILTGQTQDDGNHVISDGEWLAGEKLTVHCTVANGAEFPQILMITTE